MNLNYFQEGLDSLLFIGKKLTPEEKMLIEHSLLILQTENRMTGIYFWGRIDGIANDYFIAFGYTYDCLKDRKYFYSNDCYIWQLLPFIHTPKIFQATMLSHDPFIGDPTIYMPVKMDPVFKIEQNEVVDARPAELVRLKEEDRLAALVFVISEEAGICPRGSVYKLIDGRCAPNALFHGLDDNQLGDISYYQLYRLPRNSMKGNVCRKPDYNYPTDFLDAVDSVIPLGKSFTLSKHHRNRLIIIRSLIWPGMTFFHKLNSRKHGFAYFGNGKKNLDLLSSY
ncbi:radial spoke head protein 9 homolog [Teleopsis dalmanni]|uniref:radial spoke head protein 9 homolog n=1 Tax=Teleopsis dalmanni TaxID=139649 RepID=UPI000D32CA9D|nr:radial spoke head protein 9 homolog [Teleopsis dalmanni]